MTSVLLEKINKITKSRFGNIVSINKDTDQLNLRPQTSKVKQCAGKCKKSIPLLIFPPFLQYFLIFLLEKFKVKRCPNWFLTSLQNLKDLTWYNWKPSRHVRSHFNCSGGKFQRKVVLSITCNKYMNTAAEFNLPNVSKSVPLLIYPTNTKDTVGCVPPAYVVLCVGWGEGLVQWPFRGGAGHRGRVSRG